jgi:hypothetical protein
MLAVPDAPARSKCLTIRRSREQMETYAQKLNESEGVLV